MSSDEDDELDAEGKGEGEEDVYPYGVSTLILYSLYLYFAGYCLIILDEYPVIFQKHSISYPTPNDTNAAIYRWRQVAARRVHKIG